MINIKIENRLYFQCFVILYVLFMFNIIQGIYFCKYINTVLYIIFCVYLYIAIINSETQQNEDFYIAVILSIYAIVSFNVVLNHEIWRDEAQSFLIARDSFSPIGLFLNTRLEGHPIFWHIVITPLVHIFKSIYIFQIFHTCIGLCIAYTILKYSPFNFFYKTLIVFSYFFL